MNIQVDPIIEVLGIETQELTVGAILFRILLSVVLAAIIGCERSSKRHAAGLRTFIVVSLASTMAMLLDIYIAAGTGGYMFVLSGACVIGIAVITVNSILYSSRNQIKGLTTSVGLWACSILGLTIGGGFYTVTGIAFVAMILSLSMFPAFENYLKNRSNHFEVHLELKNASYLQDFVTTIRKLGLNIDDIELNPAYINSGLSVYSIAISINSKELKKYKTHAEIIEALSTLEYIYHIEEMK